jgi:hypothetical protein
LGVLSNGLYVVKTDLTTFHRLTNLRGGTIEFQLGLQLLEPIYLRDQPCPYFFNGAAESVQFGGLPLKISCLLANLRVGMHLHADCKVENRSLLLAECDSGCSIRRQPIGRRAHQDEALVDIFAGGLDILLVLLEVELEVLQDQRCSRRWSPLTEIMEAADSTATARRTRSRLAQLHALARCDSISEHPRDPCLEATTMAITACPVTPTFAAEIGDVSTPEQKCM